LKKKAKEAEKAKKAAEKAAKQAELAAQKATAEMVSLRPVGSPKASF
jgi:aspartyl-tRNA synthetase